MASVQNVSLEQVVTLCNSLDLLVEGMMEPNSLAMVVGMTKKVVFTKLMSKVLSEVEYQHPLEKVIHNAAFLYTQETGDDSKVFLLLFKNILNGIKDMLNNSNEMEVRTIVLKQISCLKSFLPDIFRNILNTYGLFSCVDISSPKELEDIVLTFFDSKFSSNISKKLSRVVCSFLSLSISKSNRATDALAYFISNFDVFCTKVIAPVSESKVIDGFLLHKRLLPILEHNKMVHFVIILDLPHKSEDAVWEINDTSFSQKLVNLWNSVKAILRHLKSRDISLILTKNGICDTFESLCCQNGILVISRVSKEDIDNILHLTKIFPMNNLYDSMDAQNIGCLESFASQVVGGTSFIQLKVSKCIHPYLIPHHIFLCASMDEVLNDYYSECLNSLKAVKQWLQPVNKELFLDKKISKGFQAQQCMRNESDVMFNDSASKISSENISYALGVAFPLNYFEFVFKNVLTDFCNDKFYSIKELCLILDSALLSVIHKLWNTPRKVVVQEENYKEFHEKIKLRIATPIEPALTKEILLLRVLHLVEQIVKIDAVLSAK